MVIVAFSFQQRNRILDAGFGKLPRRVQGAHKSVTFWKCEWVDGGSRPSSFSFGASFVFRYCRKSAGEETELK